MPRRNSRVWRFFCSGYSVPLQSPTNSTSNAFTSNFCPLPGLSTICPETIHLHINLKMVLPSTQGFSCKGARVLQQDITVPLIATADPVTNLSTSP